MAAIKLPRIPDRQPVRLVVHIPPDLDQQLKDYAAAYAEAYGKAADMGELIPAILLAFLQSDRNFIKAKK